MSTHSDLLLEDDALRSLVIESTELGLWDWQLSTGEVNVNHNWARLLEYTPEELSPHVRTWEKIIHPDDKPLVRRNIAAHLTGRLSISQAEYRLQTKSGDWKWVLASGKVVERGKHGRPLRMVGTLQDLTKVKQTESEYRALFHHSMNGLAYSEVIVNDNGHPIDLEFIDVNEAFELYFGVERPTVIGRQFTEIFPIIKQIKPNLVEILGQVGLTRQATKFEFHFEPLDKWFKVAAYSPRVGLCVTMYDDITDQKRAEEVLTKLTSELKQTNTELEQAVRVKDEFLATMSHELRTPLNAILGLSNLIEDGIYGDLTPKQTETVVTIQESGRHLLNLINDILDLSKIMSGRVELQENSISIETLCHYCLQLVEPLAKKKSLRLSLSVDAAVTRLLVDEDRLKQILMNLLSNAIKFTPDRGSVMLGFEGDPANQTICFTVQDTGIGIGEDHLKRLFEPFTQIDSRLSRQHQGTGLGLALVKRATELLDGEISVTSQLEQGSTFQVSLPWRVSETTVEPIVNQFQEDAELSFRKALVIEDSATEAEYMKHLLASFDIMAEVLIPGRDVVASVQAHQPDVIILDIILPKQSGWTILNQLKANPQTQPIPIIVSSILDIDQRGQSRGAEAYLTKPISREKLYQTLQNVQNTSVVVKAKEQNKDEHRPLILLVEDDDAHVKIVTEYLRHKGYDLLVACNGQQALNYLEQIQPNLILMDIQMSEMDGLETMQKIRNNQIEAVRQIPIVAVTAMAMGEDKARCLAAGADDYLAKPLRLESLYERISQLLQDST